MDRKGHPLPRSKEARHNEIPEHLVRDKGRGDDPRPVLQPSADPVTPEGEPYRYGDLGRGPEPAEERKMSNPLDRNKAGRDRKQRQSEGRRGADGLRRDHAEHQDRGQSIAKAESESESESDHG